MRDINPTEPRELDAARKETRTAEQIARDGELSDFIWLMNHRQGRRFVWRLLSIARVFSTTWSASQKEQDFLEGQRNMGLMLVADAHESCLGLYHLMEKENARNAKRPGNQHAA